MNNYLAIDTTNKEASVAIKKGKEIFFDSDSNEITHSEKLLPLIDKTLNAASLNINDIETYLITNGPGSFTGCRIGITTCKGLTLKNDNKIFAISSLLLLAYTSFALNSNKNTNNVYCSMLDARNDRVYYALYKFNYKNNKLCINYLINTSSDDINEAIKEISELNISENIIFCGDKILNFKEQILIKNNYIIDACNLILNAKYLISLYDELNEEEKENNIYNTYSLDVNYVRPSQAERIKNGEK